MSGSKKTVGISDRSNGFIKNIPNWLEKNGKLPKRPQYGFNHSSTETFYVEDLAVWFWQENKTGDPKPWHIMGESKFACSPKHPISRWRCHAHVLTVRWDPYRSSAYSSAFVGASIKENSNFTDITLVIFILIVVRAWACLFWAVLVLSIPPWSPSFHSPLILYVGGVSGGHRRRLLQWQ